MYICMFKHDVDLKILWTVLFCIFQESLKKFREEAEKLEKSESLQKAREKYVCEPLLDVVVSVRLTQFV